MSAGFTGVLQEVVLNPVYVFSQSFTPLKLSFLAAVSAPLLFIFYRHASAWIMLAPAFIFGVFSSYRPHYLIGYHYSVLFACAAFAACVYYFARAKKPFTPFIAAAMIMSALLFNYFYGNIFSKSLRLVTTELQLAPEKPDYNHLGWTGLYRGLKGEKDPEAVKIAGLIPKDYKVAADYFFSAHVSSRRYIYQLALINEADLAVLRKGSSRPEGFLLLKETGRWAFYVNDSVIADKRAGLNADQSVYFAR
jgi:uncharacterized membrane protein